MFRKYQLHLHIVYIYKLIIQFFSIIYTVSEWRAYIYSIIYISKKLCALVWSSVLIFEFVI